METDQETGPVILQRYEAQTSADTVIPDWRDLSTNDESQSIELVSAEAPKKTPKKGLLNEAETSIENHVSQRKSESRDVNTGVLVPRVTFNVGGVVFQTFENTVKNIPSGKNLDFSPHYDESRGEYFFDRDPDVFRCVLNYWRTGKLHIPMGKCGPAIHHELEMWGLEELDIEPCCWNNFNLGLDTASSLEDLRREAVQFEEDRIADQARSQSCICRCRLGLWYLMTVPKHSKASKVYQCCAILLALLSIFSFCAATTTPFQISVDSPTSTTSNSSAPATPEGPPVYSSGTALSRKSTTIFALDVIDYICLAFFTLEYIILIICAPRLCKFVFGVSGVIDLLAILPDYIEFIVMACSSHQNNEAIVNLLQMLRLMRVIRIFRVIRRVAGLWIIIYTLRASYKDLFLMLLFLLSGTLLFGSVIYFVDDIQVFTSIPHSFWWAIVTMTTVGYGDMVPVTAWGQVVASLATVCGVLLIGFTIPALVNNFMIYSNLVQFDTRQKELLAKKAAVNTGGK